MPAFVIQFFVPFRTHSSPLRTAVVRIDAGSEPASGSDRQNAGDHSPVAQRGSSRCLSSSEPACWIGSVPSSWTIRISALDAHAFATSSIATFNISTPVSVPPYSSGNGKPSRSCSPKSLRMSHGYSPLRSMSAARGATRSVTIWRMTSRTSRTSWGSA